jgi:hypothetical protein
VQHSTNTRQAIMIEYSRLDHSSSSHWDYNHEYETFEFDSEEGPSFEQAKAEAVQFVREHTEVDPAKREHRHGERRASRPYDPGCHPNYIIGTISVVTYTDILESEITAAGVALRDEDWEVKKIEQGEKEAKEAARKKERDLAQLAQLQAQYADGGA